MLYAEIIPRVFTGGIENTFTYLVPPGLKQQVQIGQLVKIPLRQKRVEGVIWALHRRKPSFPVKEIEEVMAEEPFLSPVQLKLASFISHYYLASLSSVVSSLIPARRPVGTAVWAKLKDPQEALSLLARLKAPKQKAIIEILQNKGELAIKQLLKESRASREPLHRLVEAGVILLTRKEAKAKLTYPALISSPLRIKLTSAQKEALRKIMQSQKPSLLFGVSGSGKTEIYLRAAASVLRQGKGVIILVPEIALTPQTIARFVSRFPDQVAALHSALSARERFQEWRALKRGEKKVVVGPRSALFAPIENLGLIVLDEEHDGSYKQESSPRYHAREVAEKLSQLTGAKLILGSATPSIESFFKTQTGKYQLLKLPERIFKRPPLKIFVVDMINELRSGNRSPLSNLLKLALEESFKRGEQGLLFLNRRGTSTLIACRDCGFILSCPKCNLPLVYHSLGSKPHHLTCHHCHLAIPAPLTCPQCHSANLRYLGTGTEKVAKELKALLPKARIARLDRDAVLSRENLFATYRALLDGEVDFLVGTQMIAKGWDLPGLALVGIISTDPGMHLPEYLSSERTFSLISQVVGRAGRREKIGRVIVQTTTPQSPLIKLAIQQDFKTFFKREIETRRQFKWPPFSQIVRLLSEQKNRAKAEAKIKKIEEGLRLLGDKEIIEITASPCFLEKLGGKYRYHIIIKTRKLSDKLYRFLSKLIPDLTIDVDPISLL